MVTSIGYGITNLMEPSVGMMAVRLNNNRGQMVQYLIKELPSMLVARLLGLGQMGFRIQW